MVLVLMNAHPKPRAALLYPGRCFAAVSLDQASNIADALAFGDNPRLSENPRGQLRNCERPFWKSLIFPSNTLAAPESPARGKIGIQNNRYRALGVKRTAVRFSGLNYLIKEGIVLEPSSKLLPPGSPRRYTYGS